MSSKLLHYSIVFGCLCVAVVVRCYNHQFVFTNVLGHLNFIDTDCYYQMRRLVHLLAHFPDPLIFDPLADWPHGSMVDWAEGYIMLLAVPLKLLGVHSFRGAELGACIEMILLGVALCLMNYLLARKLLKDLSLSLLVLFFTSINFLLVRYSCLGEVDHHILEAFFTVAMVYLSLEVYKDEKKWAAFTMAFLIAYSLTVSSSSIFYIGVYNALYILFLGNRSNLRKFLWITAGSMLLLFPYVLWDIHIGRGNNSLNHPSYFHLMLLTVLAAISTILVYFKKYQLRLIAFVSTILVVFYFLNWPAVLMKPLSWAIDYVFGHAGILQNVSEASPVFINYGDVTWTFVILNFGYLFYFIPLAWILLCFPKRFNLEERVFLAGVTFMSVPGLDQKRFAHLLIPLYLVFVVWLLSKALEVFRKNNLRLGFIFIVFWISMMVLPQVQFGFGPSPTPRDRVDIGTARVFIEKMGIHEQDAWDRLVFKQKVVDGFWADPNLGHLLLYVTGYGAVTNSFYHDSSFQTDFELRTIRDDDAFKRRLKKEKIRFLLVANDFKFLEMQYRLQGQPTDFVETRDMEGVPSTVYLMPKLEEFASVRLLTEEELPSDYRFIFGTRFNENHFYNYVKGIEFKGLNE